MANKVAVIIHYKQHILTGKETKYLSDIVKNIPVGSFSIPLHTVTKVEQHQNIHKVGKTRVEMIMSNLSLSPLLGDNIFQKRKLFNADSALDAIIVYEEKEGNLNFRYSIPEYESGFQRTIVKGDIDRTDASAEMAILREVKEEVGFDLDESKLKLLHGSFTNKGYQKKKNKFSVFTYELSDAEFFDINAIIIKRQQDHLGEIVDLKFTDINHIYDTFIFNPISKKIIDASIIVKSSSPKRSKSSPKRSKSKSS